MGNGDDGPTAPPSSEVQNGKVCVVMFYDDHIKEYAGITETINRKYAERHGYQFHIFRNRFDTPEGRDPQWDKVKAVSDVMKQGDGDMCHYLMWIDADAAFKDHSVEIANLFTTYGNDETEIVISSDISNARPSNKFQLWRKFPNTGTFIVKNTPWSREFFDWWWNNPGSYRHVLFHEQTRIADAINGDIMGASSKIAVVGDTVMNSNAGDLDADTYVCHMMAQPTKARVEMFTDLLEKVNKGEEMRSSEAFTSEGGEGFLHFNGRGPDVLIPFIIGVTFVVVVLALIVKLYFERRRGNS